MNFNRRDLLLTTGAAATLAIPGTTMAQNTPAASVAATPVSTEGLPNNEKRINIVTLRDLEGEAQKVMAPFGFAYVSGGAGDEWTMRENLAAFNRWVINPDFMSGTGSADTTTTILGTKISYPAITAPVGNQGSVHAQKETPNVKGTAAAGTLFCASSVSQLSLEEIAAASDGPKWFQLYIPNDRGFARELLQRAKAVGYKAIIVTADVDVTSNRERSMRLHGAALPNLSMGNVPKTPGGKGSAMDMKGDMAWSDVEFCAKESGLPVVIKSILSPNQATQALRYGCAAVWLSNHGGRQLDNSASAITTLPRVADTLKGRVPIIVDGGVHRGQDVFRALALGASVVALGRPTLYGSALGGAQGVQAVHDHLKNELMMVMRLAGTPNIKSITRNFVERSEAQV
ncbi:MAG: alpha-hydroxy-acid oxidizing protein, partial [Bradyrhizobiaceae bacterium]|nr:alpha-hydroxy-acid oxidizing protein [Bradyrhizobiaceae bacterium]